MTLNLETARSWYPANDPVHGFDHIERVYRMAERLAQAEGADVEIVRAAALLHDIEGSHPAQNNRTDHHHQSADIAAEILRKEGWTEERIAAVQHCIRAHRYRDQREPPATLEAKVLFDADKLDVLGAIGVVRVLGYALQSGQPAYAPPSARFLQTGEKESGEPHSAYHEFLFKLRRVKDRLFTPAARRIAEGRHAFLEAYFTRLMSEIQGES
ncbi:MAG: HD domain-containing protein [Chloroflexota bacterium]|nr:MAG: phosphohydrolase [Bellilinea sp.]